MQILYYTLDYKLVQALFVVTYSMPMCQSIYIVPYFFTDYCMPSYMYVINGTTVV